MLALALLVSLGLTPASFPAAAGAATLTVNTTSDELTPGDGLCSLREAVEAVDSAPTGGDCGTVESGSSTIMLGAGDFKLVFPPSGPDPNTTGDLNVSSSVSGLTIAGKGSALTTIDAAVLGDRILEVGSGAVVTLSGLTLTGGHAVDGLPGSKGANVSGGATGGAGKAGYGGLDGGAVFNDGSLTLTEVTMSGNVAGNGGAGGEGGSSEAGKGGTGGTGGAGGEGGAIFNNAGTLTLIDSTIADNRAGAGGKGGTGGTAGSSTSGGTGGLGGAGGVGPEDGGGVSNEFGTVTIEGSTIVGNSAGDGGDGGSGGQGNTTGGNGGNGGSASWGGGVSSLGGSLVAQNSTIAADAGGEGGEGGAGGGGGHSEFVPPDIEELCNPGQGGNGGNGGNGGDGGGVRVTLGTSTLSNVTLAGDSVGKGGVFGQAGYGLSCFGGGGVNGSSGSYGSIGEGGELFEQGSPAMTLEDSIVVGTSIGKDCSGSFTSAGQLDMTFGDATCIGTLADPKLGPLQDNGGPTETMALGKGSAALDLVPALGAGCPATDQRGVTRPQGSGCDLGAFELAMPVATTGGASTITETTASIAGSVTANAAQAGVRFQFGLTTAYESSTAVQHVGGVSPMAVSANLTGLKPNTTYHYRLVAETVDGEAIGSDRTFTSGASGAGSSGSPPQGPGPPGNGPGPPRISGLAIRPFAFRAANAGASIARKPRTGANVTYADSQAAMTTFVVLRPQQGVRQGKRCVLARHRSSRGTRRCLRYTKVGSFIHRDGSGHNGFLFSGRVNGRKLPRGEYVLQATPQASGLAGPSVKASFRVIG